MKKYSFEKLDDWFLNLYEEWIFTRCFEYSAIFVSDLTWYRLYANIDKKTWKIFLECAFPKNKLFEIVSLIENKQYNIRFVNKNKEIEETINGKKLEKNSEILIEIKKSLIIF
jgi:hypothetical protein